MDVLVCIPSYGRDHWEYVDRLLAEYRSMRHDVDVVLDLTEERPEGWPDPVVRTRQHDPSIEMELVYEHRDVMRDALGEYDLYVYVEDDVLITEDNLDAYVEVNDRLPDGVPTGFIRFERVDGDETPYLFDHSLRQRTLLESNAEYGGERYFRLWNLHQGSWVLTDDQLRTVVAHDAFGREPGPSKHFAKPYRLPQLYGILESGASDVYTNCGLDPKAFPIEGFERLLVHHLPNKYVPTWGGRDDPRPPTPTDLRALAERGEGWRSQLAGEYRLLRRLLP
ncbi:hypothetical protein EFA46_009340 [Halarchaeum sp. CBA1220]|uniref:hypothetical protein n=1 Tax=Halarchaeum sp. CBA1220 TaxID=1853682 RepID=UPI000F3A815C|nr:hypothetical protein [Halarchaeum sp. CBA1220]QLC34402.1 hypothetical protein EFA46_009340 [Halarchaeum sp. CBA1220]